MISRGFTVGACVCAASFAVAISAVGCADESNDGSPSSPGDDSVATPDAAKPEARDGGNKTERDGETIGDGGDDVPETPPGCTGSTTLSITGEYAAADGSEHWLRTTSRATTYALVPGGAPVTSAPPRLYRVVEVCGDQRSFVATDAAGTFIRVDWAEGSPGLFLCVAAADVASKEAALAAPRSNPTAKDAGCNGGAWVRLTMIRDGGR